MFVVNNTSLISSHQYSVQHFYNHFFYLYPISTPPSSFSFQSYFPFLQFFYITFLHQCCSRHMQSETAYFYTITSYLQWIYLNKLRYFQEKQLVTCQGFTYCMQSEEKLYKLKQWKVRTSASKHYDFLPQL